MGRDTPEWNYDKAGKYERGERTMKRMILRSVAMVLLICLMLSNTAVLVYGTEAAESVQDAGMQPAEEQMEETASEMTEPEAEEVGAVEYEEDLKVFTEDGHLISQPELLEDFVFPNDWSRAALEFAVGNGILNGKDGVLAEKENTTRAETAAMLVRMLGAQDESASLNKFKDVSVSDWFFDEISAAVAIDLLKGSSATTLSPNDPITREQACVLLSRAFGIYPANPNECDRFSDAGEISNYARSAVSAMAEQGYLNGYSDGTVKPRSYITRAELSKLIYELFTHICDDPSELPQAGRVLYRGSDDVPVGYKLNGDLTIGCGYDGTRVLQALSITGRLVIRSAPNAEIELYSSKAEKLCVPAVVKISSNASVNRLYTSGSGSTLDISAKKVSIYGSCTLTKNYDTIYCQEPGTAVTIDADTGSLKIQADNVRVVVNGSAIGCGVEADNVTVKINGDLDKCHLAGSKIKAEVTGNVNSCGIVGPNITLTSGGVISFCKILEANSDATVNGYIEICSVTGEDSRLTVNGSVEDCSFSADGIRSQISGDVNECTVSGSNVILTVLGNAGKCRFSGDKLRIEVRGKISDCEMAGQTIRVTSAGTVESCRITSAGTQAKINANVSKCVITGADSSLTIVGKVDELLLSADGIQAAVDGSVGSCDMTGEDVTMKIYGTMDNCRLTGENAVLAGEAVVENVDVYCKNYRITIDYTTLTDHVAIFEYENALSTVKTVDNWYKFVADAPYSKATMEGFVDKMGYSSKTGWLVWASTKTLTVNVFTGSKGNWTLVRTMPCAMGKPSTPTVKGVFSVYDKDETWYFGSYNCRWATLFKGGYAFHSRLWKPDYSRLVDDSISCLVSAGCVRMYDEDCKYIYDNVPYNSTVVVY